MAILLAGCSANEPRSKVSGGDDAASQEDDDAQGTPFANDVDATGGFTTFADAGGQLQAHLQVNGEGAACGECQVLLAQANGGAQPYHYAWSDPSLDGPGPHTVCPAAPARYSLVVTDSSGSTGPELTTPDERAEASVDLTCATSDGGTALSGCRVLEDKPDARVECMPEGGTVSDDGGTPLYSFFSTPIDVGLTAGVPFEYDYDQLLPISLGPASYVDVYGSDLPCGATQKLFTLQLDSVWHQAFCVTPTKAFKYSTTKVHVNGIPFSFSTTATLCGSCSAGAVTP